MKKKRYTIQLGLNCEIQRITDHCKNDKCLSIWDFMNQVNEQDKAFKKLKKENKLLKQQLSDVYEGEF